MQISIVTIFPELFDSFMRVGMTRRALDMKRLQLELINPRDFADGNHRQVDDRPYGGGPGMVMMVAPLAQAIRHARKTSGGRVIYLSPQGERLEQSRIKTLAGEKSLVVLACLLYTSPSPRDATRARMQSSA